MIPTWTAFGRLSEQSSFKAPETRLSHLCQTAKGVWLEMGDYFGTLHGHAIAQILHIIPVNSNPFTSPTRLLTTVI